MISLFRKIRQNLLAQNRATKYLLYALGEILLVVMGILIALQVNNWNEVRKAEQEEQVILTSLLEDLELAIAESRDMISRDSMDVAILRDFLLGKDLSHLAEDQTTIDSLTIVAIWGVGQSTPIIQTYNDIKSSGKTAIIQSNEIRNKLAFIDFTSNEIRNSLNDKLIVQQFQVDPIVAEYLDMVTFMEKRTTTNYNADLSNKFESLLKNTEAKNILASKQMVSKGLYLDRVAFNDLLIELTDLIRKEIKNRGL